MASRAPTLRYLPSPYFVSYFFSFGISILLISYLISSYFVSDFFLFFISSLQYLICPFRAVP